MGFNFRKSVKIAPGVKLNVSKKGVGVSAGVKGARISRGADGRTRATASIPGSGLSYQKTLSGNRKAQATQVQPRQASPRRPMPAWVKWMWIALAVVFLLAVLGGLGSTPAS